MRRVAFCSSKLDGSRNQGVRNGGKKLEPVLKEELAKRAPP